MARRIWSLLRNLLRRRAVEQALDEELQSSVEILVRGEAEGWASASGRASSGARGVWWCGANQGRGARDAGRAPAREFFQGSALWIALSFQVPRLHLGRGDFSCTRHRRGHRRLLDRQRHPAAVAAGAESARTAGSALDGKGPPHTLLGRRRHVLFPAGVFAHARAGRRTG